MNTELEKIESFLIVTKILRKFDYHLLEFLPMHKLNNRPGRELFILRSHLKRDNTILFKGSAFQPIYNKILKNQSPKLYNLYEFFLRGTKLSLTELHEFFNQELINALTEDNIITISDGHCLNNYKFVPLDNFIIVCSPGYEFDTDKYVYVGEDSVLFKKLLKNEIKMKVENAMEIGCGTGFLSLWMSHFAQNVTSVDINPRALLFTQLNAKINKINNITTKNSDVYSNIQGKYDLIISNPPYVFLPDDLTKRTFAYGGYLGMEILEKILLGLDRYLTKNGVCYLIFFSYIKDNGMDTAYEMIKKLFLDKSFSIKLTQIDYHPLKIDPPFYKQHGVSHAIRYFVRIQKSSDYSWTHIKIGGIKKISEKLKIKL